VVENPGVTLDWPLPTGFTPAEFSIYKSVGGTYSLFTRTNLLQAQDQAYTTDPQICYKISYVDVCGNQSLFGTEACPIRLTGSLQSDNTISLGWSDYAGYKDGVAEYIVEKFSPEGQLLQTFTPGTTLVLLDDAEDLTQQTLVYRVRAIPVTAGLPESISNRIVIIKNPNLFYPTAFTPNGDNLNDHFNVFGQYITDFEMNIFNRWGELLFTTRALDQGWDGLYKGNPMPEGTYTFVADITDLAGRTFKKSGSVLLLRKSK
jgi:gliding motility-associated-like protein